MADKIAPAVIGWLVLPIAAAVIGRTVGIGRSGERAEREAAKDARRDRPAPAASVPASAAPIAAVQASPVPTVAVPALCRGWGSSRRDAKPPRSERRRCLWRPSSTWWSSILNLLDVVAPGPSRLGARRLSFSYCIHEPELTMNGKARCCPNFGHSNSQIRTFARKALGAPSLDYRE
jgi:hypothetical protein